MSGVQGLRVVVTDDHPVFRRGLRVLLEDLGVDVVGEAADGQQALDVVAQTRPDVVLLDLQMPVLGGVETARRLATTAPSVAVLVLTMVEDDEAVFAALQAGAAGYLLKGAGQDEIAAALSGVAAGGLVCGPGVARRVQGFFRGGSARAAQPFPGLSDREREVLALVATGLSNADVARRLFLSEKTVKNHLTRVFSELQVTTRAEAVAAARDAGLGEPARRP